MQGILLSELVIGEGATENAVLNSKKLIITQICFNQASSLSQRNGIF